MTYLYRAGGHGPLGTPWICCCVKQPSSSGYKRGVSKMTDHEQDHVCVNVNESEDDLSNDEQEYNSDSDSGSEQADSGLTDNESEVVITPHKNSPDEEFTEEMKRLAQNPEHFGT